MDKSFGDVRAARATSTSADRLRLRRIAVSFLTLAVLVAPGCDISALLPNVDTAPTTDVVLRWNQIAIDTSGLDHTPVTSGESRAFGHQLGPCKSARAMAIVHIAMFDAINAVMGNYYEGYATAKVAAPLTSVRIAAARAAHDALVALFPSHADRLAALLQEDLIAVADGPWKDAGNAHGAEAAAAILAQRDADGSDINDPYTTSDAPGRWRVDPINPLQQALGAHWYQVKPFALNSASQFRCPAPPAMDSNEYTEAYNEVKDRGGDGLITPTIRTEEQTQIGIYWAYDGTPSLCAPPRLYNQIARQIASDRGLRGIELARLLALVNVAMADAGIAAWDSKYYYDFWRPVTGIREADPGMGPSGLGDGNALTFADPTFVPLCAPATNLTAPNFTPPFPAYPSGHATFGGALFQTLRRYFGTDDIAFTFVSDELNGVTKDNQGNVRPLVPRTFTNLSQAEEENGQSRIYLGIHWRFDKTAGIAQGRKVANHLFDRYFRHR